MSRVVVISTIYLDIPSANGICARNIVSALCQLGHEVKVICYDNDDHNKSLDGNSVYTVTCPQNDNTHGLLQKIIRTSKVILGSTDPIINQKLTQEYYNQLNNIQKRGGIDAIVAMYFPFESVEAMRLFKAQNPEVKTIVYELDSVGDGVAQTQFQNIYNAAYERWLNKIYSDVNCIVVMKSHMDYWQSRFGDMFADKTTIADIPVLQIKEKDRKGPNSPVKMIYSGLIERRYRSPSYLLSVLKSLEKLRAFEFSFYSRGDCEEEIFETAKTVHGIKQYGYVTPDQLELASFDSDYLISLGNSVSRSVPSKLINYLGYGKPIIHFSSQNNDVCNEYLSNYPLSLIIDQTKSVEESTKKIIEFIDETKGESVDPEKVRQLFKMNTPEFSASIIDSQLR